MNRVVPFTALCSCLFAANATAQYAIPEFVNPEAEGFFMDGFAEISYLDNGIIDETLLYGDFDMGYSPGKAGGLGFQLGVNATDAELPLSGDDAFTVYPTLTYSNHYGVFSLGAPRSVMDTVYLTDSVHSHSVIFDLALSLFTQPGLKSLYLAEEGDLPWGVRFDTSVRNTHFGASANRMSDINADFYSAAFRHEFGAVGAFDSLALYGGAEIVEAGFIDGNIYDVGVAARFGQLGAELSYREMTSGFDADVITAHLDYDVTPTFTVSASVLDITSDQVHQDAYGIGAEYRFMNNLFVDASYISHDLIDEDTYEFSFGIRF